MKRLTSDRLPHDCEKLIWPGLFSGVAAIQDAQRFLGVIH